MTSIVIHPKLVLSVDTSHNCVHCKNEQKEAGTKELDLHLLFLLLDEHHMADSVGTGDVQALVLPDCDNKVRILLESSIKIVKFITICKKAWPSGAGLLFSLCLYGKLKNSSRKPLLLTLDCLCPYVPHCLSRAVEGHFSPHISSWFVNNDTLK